MKLSILASSALVHLGSTLTISQARHAPSYAPSHDLCSSNSVEVVTNGSIIWPYQTYKSSNATPPALQINKTGEQLADGLLIFDLANGGPVKATEFLGIVIMTDSGDLVWSGPAGNVGDVRMQTFNDEPVLTFWSGTGTAGADAIVSHGWGEVLVYDNTYTLIATVCPQIDLLLPPGVTAKCLADIHEAQMTSRNTMLVTAYNITQVDLTSVNETKDGWVLDSLALEVNVTTGEVLWSWHSLDHVPIAGSQQPLAGSGYNTSNPWDYFHINSIQAVGENYLINSRHFWTTYLVDPAGNIIWRIEGHTGGDFGSLPVGGTFAWEHDTRLEYLNADNTSARLHMFANNNAIPGFPNPKLSTGLSLDLTLPPNPQMPPTLHTNLTNPLFPVASWSQGGYSELSNGDFFVGYGSNAVMMEYAPIADSDTTEGKVIWSAAFGNGDTVSSYHAFKQVWSATPTTNPNLVILPANVTSDALASCAAGSSYRGYVSWNGATDVMGWAVYAGRSSTELELVGMAKKSGFETEFVVPKDAAFVQVGAVEIGNKMVYIYVYTALFPRIRP